MEQTFNYFVSFTTLGTITNMDTVANAVIAIQNKIRNMDDIKSAEKYLSDFYFIKSPTIINFILLNQE